MLKFHLSLPRMLQGFHSPFRKIAEMESVVHRLVANLQVQSFVSLQAGQHDVSGLFSFVNLGLAPSTETITGLVRDIHGVQTNQGHCLWESSCHHQPSCNRWMAGREEGAKGARQG